MGSRVRRLYVPVVSSVLIVSALGCGIGAEKPIPDLIPCEGTISLDGRPVPCGTIGFAPIDHAQGHSAIGKIVNGKFKMVTTVSARGVVVGRYKVRVDGVCGGRPVLTMPQAKSDAARADGSAVDAVPQRCVPTKYSSIATSGIEVSVVKGMKPLCVELQSD